ncbi:hypothetical protein FRB96_006653 [Tulasnella sp. 330]|nr:hypothetical protein FRB96_006653 [Tulasnella sp. 330]KAG8881042.1 hypothetical protein FRB97_000231 [Tulasnella sp. 331]KAG8888436.1 hypothetical protein FRB98_007648 [Tulasnella sp. 332]
MDAYYPTSSAEYQAHVLIAEGVWWNPEIGPVDIGLCAAYAALSRYVKGEDLYLPPRNSSELQSILRSYSDHVINSLFSQIRSWARSDYRTPAAYATAREQCAKSLRAILSQSNAISKLIDLHSPPVTPVYPVTALDKDDETTTTAFEPTTASQEIRSR